MTELIPLLDELRWIERHLLHPAPHETVIGRRRAKIGVHRAARPHRATSASLVYSEEVNLLCIQN
jgi:hypothetical protein